MFFCAVISRNTLHSCNCQDKKRRARFNNPPSSLQNLSPAIEADAISSPPPLVLTNTLYHQVWVLSFNNCDQSSSMKGVRAVGNKWLLKISASEICVDGTSTSNSD
uniref:Uncharacterized protein LOC104228649 isoform X2 n=1 Tax=Nicotiana sylvestris TaxID=4096 RepID=A0A1U7WXQ0_NICSY|nr:PREDICTED: uncharacterized protein LOC104228649 isoform X2 [Nicotiana sylvestris]